MTTAITAAREALELALKYATREIHEVWDEDAISAEKQINVALAQLRAAEAEAGWRPIAEAPKDGTPILVHRYNHMIPYIAAWLDGAAISQPGWHNVDLHVRIGMAPTHWRPLPAPPAKEGK